MERGAKVRTCWEEGGRGLRRGRDEEVERREDRSESVLIEGGRGKKRVLRSLLSFF